ncbi:MAG: hypothetical protein ACXU9B_03260, partial [Reyranella sp.]
DAGSAGGGAGGWRRERHWRLAVMAIARTARGAGFRPSPRVIRDAIETHLRHQPTKSSRSRIKRLRGLERPQYWLRVDDVRIFYDVTGSTVEVLAIVAKVEADRWLNRFANRP